MFKVKMEAKVKIFSVLASQMIELWLFKFHQCGSILKDSSSSTSVIQIPATPPPPPFLKIYHCSILVTGERPLLDLLSKTYFEKLDIDKIGNLEHPLTCLSNF